ncbi:MAG: metal ABC transporter substrate-binding protein [Candidatus Brocadiia bacterium]
MKRLIIALMLILVPMFGWAEEKKLNVLTTTADLKSITQGIGREYLNVTSICEGYQDPHFAEAKPSFIVNARKADLFIKIGLELEVGYEPLIIEGSRNPKIRPGNDGHLDASEGLLLIEVPTQKVDRSMGDVHPFGNPHYWLDPYNVRLVARNINNRLQKLDPVHSEAYQNNYQAFIRRIDETMFGPDAVKAIAVDKLWESELSGKLDELITQTNTSRTADSQLKLSGWVARMSPLKGSKIIAFHRSWGYFTNRFGLIVAGEVEPKPGIPPGPGHLKDLIQKTKAEDIKAILMESFYDRKSADFVAGQTGAKVLVAALSVGGDESAKDYISLIDNLITKLTDALK